MTKTEHLGKIWKSTLFPNMIVQEITYQGRSQERAQGAGPLIECCLALLRTNNKKVSDF